ncbi:MAG: PhnD/SsuA/transferrin family substrate-binding protein [Polyangiaceae bacterium]
MPLVVLPPSLGGPKAAARAEQLRTVVSRELGLECEVAVAETYGELRGSIEAGDAWLAWTPAAVCAELLRVRAVFTVVREGRRSYRSALVGRRGAHLADARRAAWVDPLSAGGYLLVDAMLRARGVEPAAVFESQVFVGSHRAVLEAILDGTADVGAVSVHGDGDAAVARSLAWYVGPLGRELDALMVSSPCPNDAIVVTSRASDAFHDLVVERFVARRASAIFPILEAERLEPAQLSEYAAAFKALPRKTSRPPPR